MSHKNTKLGHLPKKTKKVKIRKVDDLCRLTIRSQINFALSTSELQSFIGVFNLLKPYLIHDKRTEKNLLKRMNELEEVSMQEMLMVFNLPTQKGLLMDVGIYDMDEELRLTLDAYYQQALTTGSCSVDAKNISLLATYRKASPVLYPSVSPTHAVLAFLRSGQWAEQYASYNETLAADFVPEEGKEYAGVADLMQMFNTVTDLLLANKSDFKKEVSLLACKSIEPNAIANQQLLDILISDVAPTLI